MKTLKEIAIYVKKSFRVTVIIDGIDYNAETINDLLKIAPIADGVTVEQLVADSKQTFIGDDELPFEFHGLRLSGVGTHMLFLTLSGKIIMLREAVPYGEEAVSESAPQRYAYQIYDKNKNAYAFDEWLRDATASVADYITLCKILGIDYVKNLD